MKYIVELTKVARELIESQFKYIAIDCHAPLNAQRWLSRVWEAIGKLEQFPERHGLAEEDLYKDYQVRRVVVEKHLLLFTIDHQNSRVLIIGFRHGSRLPRPEDLPG